MTEQEKKKWQPPRPPRYGPKPGEREYPQLTPEMVENIEKRRQEKPRKTLSKTKAGGDEI